MSFIKKTGVQGSAENEAADVEEVNYYILYFFLYNTVLI